jgi:hypothetical protein
MSKGKRRRRIKQDRFTAQLGLVEHRRLCAKCGINTVYLDIATMDWCEPCIWAFVQRSSSKTNTTGANA